MSRHALFRPLKWRFGGRWPSVRLRGRGNTLSAKADIQPKASEPRIYSSDFKMHQPFVPIFIVHFKIWPSPAKSVICVSTLPVSPLRVS